MLLLPVILNSFLTLIYKVTNNSTKSTLPVYPPTATKDCRGICYLYFRENLFFFIIPDAIEVVRDAGFVFLRFFIHEFGLLREHFGC